MAPIIWCKWHCRYTLSDGQDRYEKGVVTTVGNNTVYDVVGWYTFQLNGTMHRVLYTSGVNGYKAHWPISGRLHHQFIDEKLKFNSNMPN